MKTLKDVSVKGKVVVVRSDMNVPIKNGQIQEATRINASIPTLKYLLENDAKEIHVLTHIGRPKGKVVPELSTEILQAPLSDALGVAVSFNPNWESDGSQVQLHQNVRFDASEKENGKAMRQKLLHLKPELFVLDAFGTAHRAHASVVGLSDPGINLDNVAGLLFASEIAAMAPYVSSSEHKKQSGLTVIVGGAKMETKIGILQHFATTADNILVGGALANTFLAAQGFDVGQSLFEEEKTELAMEIMATAQASGCGFHVPIDVICADEITADSALDIPVEDVIGGMKIFDIGPHTVRSYQEIINHSQTIIWNGPMGVTEFAPFKDGTKNLLASLAKTKAKVIIGGGDSLAAMAMFGFSAQNFDHVSTGGGAMLEFLEGKVLPGVLAVSKRS